MNGSVETNGAAPTPAPLTKDEREFRDVCAVAALIGILAGRRAGLETMDENKVNGRCFQFADAMLRARAAT